MNAWLVGAIVLLAGVLALAPVVASWFDPSSPARVVERLLLVLNTWGGIRDFVAQVAVRGAEGEILGRLLFLAPANLRLDVLAPGTLAGESFALRPVDEGWLFVHHRPALDLGIEARITSDDLTDLLALPPPSEVWEGLRRNQIRVAYVPAPTSNAARPPSDEFDITNLPGRFPRIVLQVDPSTQLPREVTLYQDPGGPPSIEIEVRHLAVNTRLELRDVFLLDPPPSRWLTPTPPG
ncbi:MAG: hypothetical protein Kow0097_06410 [Candidatus Bipolaricaulota bacterium]|nr:hypothetical protein [Candidatus Bipolaricaulota bacterium]